jgi:hypothetical protein
MSSKEVPHTLTGAGVGVVIWGDHAKLVALVPGVVADAAAGAADITFTRAGASVKRYPGDPNPYTRAGGTVVRLKQKPAKLGTLPGRPFTIEVTTGTAPDEIIKVHQFSFTGPFTKLHAFVEGAATSDYILRSPGGKPYAIQGA